MPKGVKIPVAVSVFPGELYEAPRSWTSRPIPSSSTTTGLRKAATSPRGSSRDLRSGTQGGVQAAALSSRTRADSLPAVRVLTMKFHSVSAAFRRPHRLGD